LEQNKKILVCSTPCQIAGIRAAFDCKNITLIDILCLGVPSPLVFDKYIKSVEKKNNKKIKNVNFRDKTTSWKTYSQTIIFEDDNTLSCANNKSPYMLSFLNKISIRPSCAKCHFSDTRRVGDITIGDYWGIENSHPELDSPKGVSVVYVNSKKGKALFDKCDEIEKHLVKKEETLQQALIKPTTLSDKRAEFFEDLKTCTFDKLEKKYLRQHSRIVQFAINMLKY
jgi:coenzyme F420-reducing hydrogenase beta subunit